MFEQDLYEHDVSFPLCLILSKLATYFIYLFIFNVSGYFILMRKKLISWSILTKFNVCSLYNKFPNGHHFICIHAEKIK